MSLFGAYETEAAFDLTAIPNLPQDNVLAQLPCDEVARLCTVDRAHRDMCNAPDFWENQYRMRHQASAAAAAPAVPSVWPNNSGTREEYRDECLFVTGKRYKTFRGHTLQVLSVAFSPDGRTLATGSADYTAKLWDVSTRALKATLQGHTFWVHSVAFSPDGRTLATGSLDYTAKLWDMQTGVLKATLQGHTNRVYSVAFSPDGRTIATGSGDGTAKLWDMQTGALKATFRGHTGNVRSVAFSPDGRTLATSMNDMAAKLWAVPA